MPSIVYCILCMPTIVYCILCMPSIVYWIRIRNVVLVFASGQPTLPYHLLAYQQYSVKAVISVCENVECTGIPPCWEVPCHKE